MRKLITSKRTPKKHKSIIISFIKFCVKELHLASDFSVILVHKKNDYNISTGGFDRHNNKIFSRIEGRAIIDIIRTIAHEFVHLQQKEANRFTENSIVQDVGGPIEDEANAVAGQLVKKFAYNTETRKEFGDLYKL